MPRKALWRLLGTEKPRFTQTTVTSDTFIWDAVKKIGKEVYKPGWLVMSVITYGWLRKRNLIPEDYKYEELTAVINGSTNYRHLKRDEE